MAKYICKAECTWAPDPKGPTLHWPEGRITEDLPKGVKPPEHFELLVEAPKMVAQSSITDPLAAAAAGEHVSPSEIATGKRVAARDTTATEQLEKTVPANAKQAAIEAFNT